MGWLPVLAGCRGGSDLGYKPSPEAPNRRPFAAVVWQFDDQTPGASFIRPARDGVEAFETGLTRSSSFWRPRLTMEGLSRALASEVKAQLTEKAWVTEDRLHTRNTFEDMAKGAKLFIGGRVQEASWVRTEADGGHYRLKLWLYANIGRRRGLDVESFWVKTLQEDVPHGGWADKDLAAAFHRMFAGAVADLGKALDKEPAVSALADESPPPDDSPDK